MIDYLLARLTAAGRSAVVGVALLAAALWAWRKWLCIDAALLLALGVASCNLPSTKALTATFDACVPDQIAAQLPTVAAGVAGALMGCTDATSCERALTAAGKADGVAVGAGLLTCAVKAVVASLEALAGAPPTAPRLRLSVEPLRALAAAQRGQAWLAAHGAL